MLHKLAIVGLVALLSISSAFAAEEVPQDIGDIPGVNMDDYHTDRMANLALGDQYPKGTPIAPVLDALGRSIPEMTCTLAYDDNYICVGVSLFRADFIYRKEWTVSIYAPEHTLENISAASVTRAVKDETELMLLQQNFDGVYSPKTDLIPNR